MNEDEGASFKLHHTGSGLGEQAIHQQFGIPRDTYSSIKDAPLRVEVDYALTILGRNSTAVVPVLFSRRPVAGLGVCASQVGWPSNGATQIRCHPATDNAQCFLVDLKDTATGLHNPLNDQCTEPVYQPRFLAAAKKLAPVVPAVYANFPYGLDSKRFPVGVEAMSTSELTIAGYTPQAHVWRHLETPLLRLRDL